MAKRYYQLNDASRHDLMFAPGSTEIWYMRPDHFADLMMTLSFKSSEEIDPEDVPINPLALGLSHIMLGRVKMQELRVIYHKMQGEYWSPNGEARSLIQELGLQHTSMSVGDVMVVKKKVIVVSGVGFIDIGRVDT